MIGRNPLSSGALGDFPSKRWGPTAPRPCRLPRLALVGGGGLPLQQPLAPAVRHIIGGTPANRGL